VWSVRVEVDRVGRLLGRDGARVHREADVRPGQGRRVVGAEAVIATGCAAAGGARVTRRFSSGLAGATTPSTPASRAIVAAVSGLSPVTMIDRMPIFRGSSNRSRTPGSVIVEHGSGAQHRPGRGAERPLDRTPAVRTRWRRGGSGETTEAARLRAAES
jgi:hypothetical protein